MTDVIGAVLAGGLGTRLRSVVADRPKVLATVSGRPFLTYLLDQLARVGVHETVLLVGYGAEQVRSTIGTVHGGMKITYSQEPEPLGTGGALRYAQQRLQRENILLLNGDSCCDVNLSELLQVHRSQNAAATLTLTEVENCDRYGCVALNEADQIARFEEKQANPGAGWINAGVYVLSRKLVDEIPEHQFKSLERDLLPIWVTNQRLFGFRCRGRFLDIGVPESYGLAEQFMSRLFGSQSTRAN